MLERLIENWLSNSGERGYEVAFAQLLAAEGHRIIQGPVHHPFEHGKDIFTFASDGALHAYQLKGPDLTRLEDFEKIQPQLLALAATAITHPAVTPPRRPDRTFLVSNAVLTPPVRDRIEKFNTGNASLGYGPIEPVERDQLVTRFLAAHGKYLPEKLADIRTLIELYYSEPEGVFPVRHFAKYLESLLPLPPVTASRPELKRATASIALLTAYATSSWVNANNHLAVAQAWLTTSLVLVRFANATASNEELWKPTYDLAVMAARSSLAALSKEAADAPDLVVPDLVEGFVYPARVVLVGGYLSAYFISEQTLGGLDEEGRERVGSVLRRERSYAKISCEAEIPSYLMMSAALEQLGEIRDGEMMSLSLVSTLAKTNQKDSLDALPDPYHTVEDVLLHRMGGDSGLEGEQFDGHSQMLDVAIEWVARRLWRQFLASQWSQITRVQLVRFEPSSPGAYLAESDSEGDMRLYFAGQPQSWAALLRKSRTIDKAKLPDLLWTHRELIPYLPLLFPYRFTTDFARIVDAMVEDPFL